VAAGLIFVRLAWGLGGTRYARFRQFVRSPIAVLGYLNDIRLGRERRYVGHNPAGGAMVLALMLTMAVASLSGWMMTTDAYFGDDTVQAVHSLDVHGMLLLIALHVGGIILASLRHHENLIRAMITGRKRAAEVDDVA
ncbi:MAG: cytochrome b/b6 domain-containing protein, partial [Paracoccaceae bacterium]